MEAVEILPDGFSHYDLSFKIILIGNSNVGKSCITMKGVKNLILKQSTSTVGFEFLTFSVKLGNIIIKLQIWDTCGQEIYKSLVSSFYRNTSLAILVYSIDNRNSFNDIDKWLKELRSKSNPDVKLFLIGNKLDLEINREVSRELAIRYKYENNVNYFEETSALTGYNCREMFILAAKILYEDYLQYHNSGKDSTYRPYDTNQRLPNSIYDPNMSVKLETFIKKKDKCKC